MTSLSTPLLPDDAPLQCPSHDTGDQESRADANGCSDNHMNETKSHHIALTWKNLFGLLLAMYLFSIILFFNKICAVYLYHFNESYPLAIILVVLSTFLPARLYFIFWRDSNVTILEDLETAYKREYIDKFDLEANEENVRKQSLAIGRELSNEASLRLKVNVAVPLDESALENTL